MTGKRLAQLRKMAGLTQAEMAELMVYHPKSYARLEKLAELPPHIAERGIAKLTQHVKRVEKILHVEPR